jgi:hypothetical protein
MRIKQIASSQIQKTQAQLNCAVSARMAVQQSGLYKDNGESWKFVNMHWAVARLYTLWWYAGRKHWKEEVLSEDNENLQKQNAGH